MHYHFLNVIAKNTIWSSLKIIASPSDGIDIWNGISFQIIFHMIVRRTLKCWNRCAYLISKSKLLENPFRDSSTEWFQYRIAKCLWKTSHSFDFQIDLIYFLLGWFTTREKDIHNFDEFGSPGWNHWLFEFLIHVFISLSTMHTSSEDAKHWKSCPFQFIRKQIIIIFNFFQI